MIDRHPKSFFVPHDPQAVRRRFIEIAARAADKAQAELRELKPLARADGRWRKPPPAKKSA